MTTFYSDLAAIQNAPTIDTLLNAARAEGQLFVSRPTWTIETGVATTTPIRLCRIPKGAYVIVPLCSVYAENPGSALVVDIGDEDASHPTTTSDEDAYADGLTLSSGGQVLFTAQPGAALLTPRKVYSDTWVTVTPKTVTSLTVEQKLTFTIVWAKE